MKELINMHIHTDASDGEYEINELLKMISQTNLETISITDHDTIKAYENLDTNLLNDITLINGCEFSAISPSNKKGARLHILGYDLDLNNENLHKLFKIKKENNINNLLIQINYLEQVHGIVFKPEDIEQILKKDDFGRPDIAKLLIKYGYAMDFDEAFDNYLIDAFFFTKPSRKEISAEIIFDTIKKANGYISIAHIISNKFEDNELEHFLDFCKSNNVDAIELYHPSHNQEYKKYLSEKIDKYKFLISGGTDYHGPSIKPNRFLEYSIQDNIKIKHLSLKDRILQK